MKAKYNLGLLYADGHGVLQDYTKAAQWFEQAAAQGAAKAQNNLGVMYDMGYGVPRDYAKVRHWWEQAAGQGDGGALYADGHGVPQNNVKAYMWWSLAVAHSTGQRQEFVGNILDEVAHRMTPAQITEHPATGESM